MGAPERAGEVGPSSVEAGDRGDAQFSEAYTHTGVGAVAAVPKAGAEPGATFTQISGVTGERAQTR